MGLERASISVDVGVGPPAAGATDRVAAALFLELQLDGCSARSLAELQEGGAAGVAAGTAMTTEAVAQHAAGVRASVAVALAPCFAATAHTARAELRRARRACARRQHAARSGGGDPASDRTLMSGDKDGAPSEATGRVESRAATAGGGNMNADEGAAVPLPEWCEYFQRMVGHARMRRHRASEDDPSDARAVAQACTGSILYNRYYI